MSHFGYISVLLLFLEKHGFSHNELFHFHHLLLCGQYRDLVEDIVLIRGLMNNRNIMAHLYPY